MTRSPDPRTPHPLFGIAWALWAVAQLVGVYWPNPWYLGGLQVYFGLFEIGGLVWHALGGNTHNRLHQLSQMAFWSYRKVSKVSEKPVTLWSWGGAYVGFILIIAWNAGVFAMQMGVSLFLSVPVLALLCAWLIGHWLMSWRYG